MNQQVIDVMSDATTITFWAKALIPIVGSVALTQIWKLNARTRSGRKPRGYTVALVSAFVCTVLSTLVYWLFGDPIKQALGYGVLIGPASPILWRIVQACVPLPVKIAMRGTQREHPRTGERVWSDEERALFDDERTQAMKAYKASGEK